MGICGSSFDCKDLNTKNNEHIEKCRDTYYEYYYTQCAKNHLNRILKTYNRNTQDTFEKSLASVKNIGLYQPCADNLNYLKNMRYVSMTSRIR